MELPWAGAKEGTLSLVIVPHGATAPCGYSLWKPLPVRTGIPCHKAKHGKSFEWVVVLGIGKSLVPDSRALEALKDSVKAECWTFRPDAVYLSVEDADLVASMKEAGLVDVCFALDTAQEPTEKKPCLERP